MKRDNLFALVTILLILSIISILVGYGYVRPTRPDTEGYSEFTERVFRQNIFYVLFTIGVGIGLTIVLLLTRFGRGFLGIIFLYFGAWSLVWGSILYFLVAIVLGVILVYTSLMPYAPEINITHIEEKTEIEEVKKQVEGEKSDQSEQSADADSSEEEEKAEEEISQSRDEKGRFEEKD